MAEVFAAAAVTSWTSCPLCSSALHTGFTSGRLARWPRWQPDSREAALPTLLCEQPDGPTWLHWGSLARIGHMTSAEPITGKGRGYALTNQTHSWGWVGSHFLNLVPAGFLVGLGRKGMDVRQATSKAADPHSQLLQNWSQVEVLLMQVYKTPRLLCFVIFLLP
jgi:hypothetical protein